MRRSESTRARRTSVTEQHFLLLPVREGGDGGGIRLRASTADGPSPTAGDLPEFLLDERCRLAVRGQGQARLHRLGRSCPLSAEQALVVLDGDVLERGDRRWQIRFEATWRIWQEDASPERRSASWPAAFALAACLGGAPMAKAETATERDQRVATSPSPGRLPAPTPGRQTSQAAPAMTEASDPDAQDGSSPSLGRLVVKVIAPQTDEGIFRARLSGFDGSVDQQQSSRTNEFVFADLPAGVYHLAVVQDGVANAPMASIDLEVADGAPTQAEVTLGPPPLSEPEPIGEMIMGIARTPIPHVERRFGNASRPYDDGPDDEESGYDDDGGRGGRRWPSSLTKRPLTPWEGLAEARASGDIDLGANHAGSPIRVAPSVAYGIDRRWGIAVDTRRGLCMNGGDARCERRFDQVSADLIHVLDSGWRFEWLVRGGLATGPFGPFALSLRMGGAAKVLVRDHFAIQVEFLAQVPVNQRDQVPTLIQIPAQLQVQLVPHVATYLSMGFRGAFLSGERELTVPAAAGLLFGWHAFDLGVEWRFPRVLGTGRTWDESSLLVLVAARLD